MNSESDIAVFLLALCSLAHKYNAKQICRSTAQVEMRIVYCAVVVGLGVCVRFVAYSRLLPPKCESLSGNKCVCSCIEIETDIIHADPLSMLTLECRLYRFCLT